MIPLLVRPKFLALKNRLLLESKSFRDLTRDLVLVFFAIFIMVSIFRGTVWAMHKINTDPTLALLPPSQPLALILMILLGMLFISSIVGAMGTFFMSDDLDLLPAAPIGSPKFFFGKFSLVLFGASWMSLIFIAPLILGMGYASHAGISYYILGLLATIPYFVIPAALGVLVAVLFLRFVPPHWSRIFLYVLGGLVLFAASVVAEIVNARLGHSVDGGMGRVLQLFSSANREWLPSLWLSITLQELVKETSRGFELYLLLLLSVSVGLCSAAYLAVQLLHRAASDVSRSSSGGRRRSSRTINSRFRGILTLIGKQRGALVRKELITFSREITYTLQLVMLAGLTLIYLLNLKVFFDTEVFSVEARRWWQSFFFVSNWSIGAFVCTGVCTRFVYPSLSLEGRAFWILATSPMHTGRLLWAKFECWYPAVALISACVLSTSAFAVGATASTILMTALTGFAVAYGVVGLAIGLGARFANFTWEHPSQLAAGLGSMVFMLCSVILIFINLLPLWVYLFYDPVVLFGEYPFGLERFIHLFLFAVSMYLLNLVTARVSLRDGAEALAKQWK